MLKKCLCLFLSVIMLFSLSSCTIVNDFLGGALFPVLIAAGDDRADKEDIFAFVEDNQDQLLTCIQENDYSEFENHTIIKSIDAYDNAVDFACGGAGIGSGTAYCGFYYTANNDMTAVWCAPFSAQELAASGDGFEWQEENSDNRYYTEKICEYFYYYEASF